MMQVLFSQVRLQSSDHGDSSVGKQVRTGYTGYNVLEAILEELLRYCVFRTGLLLLELCHQG